MKKKDGRKTNEQHQSVENLFSFAVKWSGVNNLACIFFILYAFGELSKCMKRKRFFHILLTESEKMIVISILRLKTWHHVLGRIEYKKRFKNLPHRYVHWYILNLIRRQFLWSIQPNFNHIHYSHKLIYTIKFSLLKSQMQIQFSISKNSIWRNIELIAKNILALVLYQRIIPRRQTVELLFRSTVIIIKYN